jgi:hypothetical protein
LFLAIYIIYFFGLIVSWQRHRKAYPLLLFAFHLLFLGYHIFIKPTEWVGYVVVISVMATSILNQYFRIGSIECEICEVDQTKEATIQQ